MSLSDLFPDKQRYHRWHQAADTGATTLLPSDPKGSS